MILTGKALDDFENWAENTYDDCGNGQTGKRLFYIESIDDYKFIKTEHYIHNIGDSMLHALIIEWFDSVGINLCITPIYIHGGLTFKSSVDGMELLKEDLEFKKTRQEATKQAIIRANEIYNNKGA